MVVNERTLERQVTLYLDLSDIPEDKRPHRDADTLILPVDRLPRREHVVTTAQVFGRKAPILVTAEMLNAMKPGSVVVDLAVETGGNVEGVAYDKVIDRNGVKIIGIANLPGRVPLHASQVYSANLTNLIEEFWDKQNKNFVLKLDDEIIKGCLVTHGGKIVNEKLIAKPS